MVVVIDNSRRRPGIAGRKSNSRNSSDIYYRAQSGGIIYEGTGDTNENPAVDSCSSSSAKKSDPPSREISFDELPIGKAYTTKVRSNTTTKSMRLSDTCPPLCDDAKKIVRGIENQSERQLSPRRKQSRCADKQVHADSLRQQEGSFVTSSESQSSSVRLFVGALLSTANDTAQSQSLSLPIISTNAHGIGLPPTSKATKNGADDETRDSATEANASIIIDTNTGICIPNTSLLLPDGSAAQVAALLAENASLRQAALDHREQMNRADHEHQTTVGKLQEHFNRTIEEMQEKHNQEISEIKEQNERRLLEAECMNGKGVETKGLEKSQDRLVSQDATSEALPLQVGEAELTFDDTIRPTRRSPRLAIPRQEALSRGKKQVPRNLFKGKQKSSVDRSVPRLSNDNDASLGSKRTTKSSFLTYGGTPLVSCKRLCPGLQYVVRSPSFSSGNSKE